MLPHDYPEDFEHAGLLDVWFDGIPWSYQQKVMNVETRLRCIRNPATQVFVVVLKLNDNDKERRHPFFATAMLDGWVPIVETQRGQPVEAMTRVCEGMQASAKWFDEHRHELVMSAAQQAARREQWRVAEMSKATKESVAAIRSLLNPKNGSSMRQGMSPARRAAMFRGAAAEYAADQAQREKKPFSLVTP